MIEDFLHFIWKFKLYDTDKLYTTDGDKIQVISVGLPNKNSGPDFINARIKIGNTEWVGNVEIHIKSSDWQQHKHHTDGAYNNVILHVVKQHNRDVYGQDKIKIPTLVLNYHPQLEERYQQMINSSIPFPCQPSIKKLESFHIRHFLNRILVERLERKSADIIKSLGNSRNNWNEAFYQLLFRCFGFGVNALPFQLLAQHTPLRLIEKYGNNIFQIEALLFGQAGFLEDKPVDDYQSRLKGEYEFLKTTYNLKPMEKGIWKFGRMRPANFPTIRIAQLSQLLKQKDKLVDSILTIEKINDIISFQVGVSTYWRNHYIFGKEGGACDKNLGRKSVEKLIVNLVVPFLFTYGEAKGDEKTRDRALTFLEAVPPEKNSIVELWENAGFKAENSFYSQAILQLSNNYCDHKRCLDCAIGKLIITMSC